MRLAARLLVVAALPLLGACSSTSSWDPRKWFSKDEAAAPKASRRGQGFWGRLSSGAPLRASWPPPA